MAIILNEAATRRSVERSMQVKSADNNAENKMRSALKKALMIRELTESKNRSSTFSEKDRYEIQIRAIENEIREVI